MEARDGSTADVVRSMDSMSATRSTSSTKVMGRAEDSGSGTPQPRRDRGRAALSGVLAVAVALGAAELVAALVPGAHSLVIEVGDLVIDSVPGWLERAAIATLGRADKPALLTGILLVCGALGAVLGVVALRRLALAVAGFVAAGVLGFAAALADSEALALPMLLAAVAGVAAGIGALMVLLRAARKAEVGDRVAGETRRSESSLDRRGFLRTALGAAALAVIGGVGAQLLAGRRRLGQLRAAVSIPPPAEPAPPAPPGASLDITGLTPLYVPNEDFYRIDTALRVPQVDPTGWSLRVDGMVEQPFTLTYDELLSLPHIEADITLSCVSNEVGGGLVGNARWQGVPLHVLLDRAGVQKGATQILGRSVDGFTAGFPTITALDVRESMVAVAMNGEPLPAVHGFPARLVVPGLYGYVSATKWLSSIELTTFELVQGYWIPRGWAREGPVKTQSRIDVPSRAATVVAGRTPIAGVAWAPTRGIERVEVRIDDGPWTQADLAAPLDVDSWRQWVLPWDATPGRHTISVRATDGAGQTQTAERTPVAPDGATGHHTISVDAQPAA